jgi:transcriptional regulator GlxA family with amidase domain
MNMSVTEYRDCLRNKSAKEMLASGCFSVKETANILGYYDVYHFTKIFTRQNGISPAKYARTLR